MRKILLLAIIFLTTFTAFGQDFSNKGKDFWTAYGYHTSMLAANGGSQDMVLYFATDQATNIVINIPATGYTQNITTAAGNNVVTSAVIPKTGAQDARLLVGGLSNNGIHITSDKPMVAYAHIYNGNCSGATILYPTNTLGREYYSVNYKNWSNNNNANCWLYVVATDTGTTTIQITPQADQIGVVTTPSSGSWVAGTTYTVNLTQGQIYNVMGILTTTANTWKGVDLTGSKIKSINNGSGCKKIGVFSGSGRISISCTNSSSSSDNYMVQAMPRNAWGKKYLTVQANGNQAINIYRVCVSSPAAVVKINGAVTGLPLLNNFYYEIPATNLPQLITADSAIMVAQYFTSQGACGNGGSPGDPEVIYLSAVEQNINKVIWNATPNFAITSHSLSLVIPNTGTALSSFKLNGAAVTGWVTHPQDPGYSYLRQNVGVGFNIMQSDSGFNAIAYGFGNAESYGYNAGTNIKDLYQQIGVSTTYGIETTPSVCTNSPFKFKVSLPYIPDSMRWNFNGAVGMSPNNNTVYVNNTGNTAEDSTTVVNGRTLHWYSIPTQYSFSIVGVYPITITTFVPNGECGAQQDIDFDLGVSNPPVANFTWTAGGCVAEPYQFTETTPQFPKATYRFWWNFGDPGSGPNNDTSNLRNPVHTFSAPGTYTVRYGSITTPGCLSDTISQTVIVPDFPNATIAGNTTVCINTGTVPVIFTGTLGTPQYIFSYNINGGATIVTPPSTSGTFTINAPTTVAGTFVYNLVGVRNELPVGTPCTRTITGQSATIIVTPNATVTLSSAAGTDNQTVCINTPITNITYAVAGSGTGGAVSGLPAGVTGIYAAGVITITGTPTVTGTFNYTVTTTGPCLTPQATGTITVTANGTLALTSTAGSDNQTLCINTPLLTNITYAIGGTATGGSVSGLPAGVTGVLAGGVITISGTPTVAGVFNYTVTTTGPCIIPTATGTITVTGDGTLTLTSAGSTTNQSLCINIPIVNITYAVAGTATGGSVSGLPAGVNGVFSSGVITISGTPTAPGVFNYTVTTTGPCVIPTATGTITVTDDGTLTLTSAAGSNNQTLCINTPLLINITYAVGGSGTGGSVSGLPAGVTGVFAGGVVTISGTPTAAGLFNYTVTTTGPCIKPTASGTITVTGDGTLTLTSAASTTNQSLCINIPIVNITYAVSGTVTGGSVSGLPPGVNGVFAGGVVTISGTPTLIGTYNYTVTTTGPCVIPQANGVITVNPNASVTLTSAAPTTSQALCRNSTINNITYAVAGGGTGAIVSGLPAGVTGVYAGGIVTISGVPTVAGVFNYTVNTTGTCIQANATGTITVHQLPTANFSSSAPSCATRTISFSDLSVGNTGAVNAWSWNFGDGSPLGNTQNPTHVYIAAGIYNVTLTVTTASPFGCVSNPIANIPVTINNRPQAGFIIPEVCLSDTYAQFLDTSKLTNAVIDRWDWNFGDPGSGPLNTSILQNPTHSYSAVGTYNVRLIVWNFAKGCRDTITQVLQVNGSFPNAVFSVNNPTTLCANDSVAVVEASTVFPGVITKIEIWWDDVNAGPPAPPDVDIAPFTGKVYKHLYPNFQSPLTKTFRIRYRAYSGGVCLDDSLRNITVNAAPLVQFNNIPNTCLLVSPFQIPQPGNGGVPGSGTFSGPGVSPTGMFNPQVAGIGTHTILYTYTSTAAGCRDTMSKTITVLDTAHATFSVVLPSCEQIPTSFTDLSTAPAGVVLANTVWNFGDLTPVENHAPGSTFGHLFPGPGTYTVTMHNVSAVGCLSTDTSQVITINPNHAIALTTNNSTQTICVNINIADIKYQLSGGATNIVMPPSGLPPGVTASVTGNVLTLSGAPTLAGVYNYSIQTTGNTCVVATATGRITVDPDHAISLTSNNNTQTLCVNTSIADITYQLSGGATNIVMPPAGLPPGVIASVTGNVVTLSGAPTLAGVYNYSIQTTGNACVVAIETGIITVDPDHTIALTSGNNTQTVCINIAIAPIVYTLGGGATGVTVTGLPAGVNFALAGNTLTISGTPNPASGGPLFPFTIVTTGNTCVVANAAGSITVLPDHTIALTTGNNVQTVCINTPIAPIVYDLGGGATGATVTGLPAGVSYVVAGNTLTISGTPNPLSGGPLFPFTIVTTGNSCVVANASGSIDVQPDHTIALTTGNNTQTVCFNIAIAPIVYTLGGGATGVTVTGLPAGVTFALAGSTLTISGTPNPASGGPLFPFTIVTTGNTCIIANAAGSINVLPDHTIALTSGNDMQSVCVNTPIDPITYDLGGGATSASVTGLPAGINSLVTGNILTISGTPTTTVGGPSFLYTITTGGNACVQASAAGEIKVHPYPVPDFTFDKGSYCIPNAIVGFINNTTPTPLSNYTYEWDFDDGSPISTAVAPSHLYTSARPFNVQLKARSTVLLNGGIIGCESMKINLLDIIHPQPKADFVLSKPSVCIGDAVTITDATDGMGSLINQWHWEMGDGVTKTTNPVTYTYGDTITYIITMYTVNGFGCNSDTINKLPLVSTPYKPFTVNAYPTVNAGPDKFVLEGGSVQLDATAYAKEPVYTWTPVQFLTDSKILRPRVVNPATDMTYRLTVTGKGGCQFSDVVFVKLLKFPAIPNTFTPNNDGINDQWRIDFLNTYSDNRVQIFTRAGKLVFESRGYNTPWDGTLKGKPLPFDTYYYIIEPGNGRDPITGYVTILK